MLIDHHAFVLEALEKFKDMGDIEGVRRPGDSDYAKQIQI